MADVTKDSQDLDAYIKQAIETDFPMFKVKEVIDRQLPEPNNLVGLVSSDDDRMYTFFIDLKDPRPMLQAV